MTQVEEVVALEAPWAPSPGVPAPVLWQTESEAVLIYKAAAATEHEGEHVVLVFAGCMATQFGYPNDEALPGHPLASKGLGYYDIFEVLNSSWLARLTEQNRKVFPNAAASTRQPRHFVVTFHDSTFECLADGYAGQFTTDSVEAVLLPRIALAAR